MRDVPTYSTEIKDLFNTKKLKWQAITWEGNRYVYTWRRRPSPRGKCPTFPRPHAAAVCYVAKSRCVTPARSVPSKPFKIPVSLNIFTILPIINAEEKRGFEI